MERFLSNWLVKNKEQDRSCYPMVPCIICEDGFSLSVQCNSGSYGAPREDYSDFYWQGEVGYPSEKPDFIMGHCENPHRPTDTIYPYVEIELVEQLILQHGGISEEKTAKLKKEKAVRNVFETWWARSKYTNVITASKAHKQLALDGFNAAMAFMESK